MTSARQTIDAVVRGDVSVLSAVETWSADEIAGADAAGPFVLTAAAVADVLARYAAGAVTPQETQRWAAFVRRGYLPGREPVVPIDIHYEKVGEDAIVEALARLDELGDMVDGEISVAEASALEAALNAVPAPGSA